MCRGACVHNVYVHTHTQVIPQRNFIPIPCAAGRVIVDYEDMYTSAARCACPLDRQVCMYVCIHVCMYACAFVHVCMCVRTMCALQRCTVLVQCVCSLDRQVEGMNAGRQAGMYVYVHVCVCVCTICALQRCTVLVH